MTTTKKIKIAPSLDEVRVEGRDIITEFRNQRIVYHMAKDYTPADACCQALRMAIASASHTHHIQNNMTWLGIEGNVEVTNI